MNLLKLLILIPIIFAHSLAQNINTFIPKDYTIVDSVSFDYNKDNIPDKILILETTVIDKDGFLINDKRLFLILRGTEKSGYKLKLKNENIILKKDGGGMLGDPYIGIQINGDMIVISHYGGTSSRWGLNHSYCYIKEKDTWYLVKKESSTVELNIDIDAVDEETKIYTEEDNITIENYNIND